MGIPMAATQPSIAPATRFDEDKIPRRKSQNCLTGFLKQCVQYTTAGEQGKLIYTGSNNIFSTTKNDIPLIRIHEFAGWLKI
jgi:hypothetical protein